MRSQERLRFGLDGQVFALLGTGEEKELAGRKAGVGTMGPPVAPCVVEVSVCTVL